jgi:ribosomal protein S6--L-glutamate ligase
MDSDTFEIELTLANRDSMEFRMLIGREALNNRYLVNPSVTNLLPEMTLSYNDNIQQKIPADIEQEIQVRIEKEYH